jgi:integrase
MNSHTTSHPNLFFEFDSPAPTRLAPIFTVQSLALRRIFYRDSLRMPLLPFCDREGLTRPEEVTPEVIDRLAIELEGRLSRQGNPLSPATRRSYLKAVQQFLSWLERRKKVSGVEARLVQMPGLRRKHRDVLMRQEIQQLEDAAPMERNTLLIRLMGDAGAREGEVASLRLEDLVAKERSYFIRIRGKTGERMAPITPSVHTFDSCQAHHSQHQPIPSSAAAHATSLFILQPCQVWPSIAYGYARRQGNTAFFPSTSF